MSKQLCYADPEQLKTLAGAIRNKKGVSNKYTIQQMAQMITNDELSGGNTVSYQPLTITPSEQPQTFTSSGSTAYSPISVEAIPDNYLTITTCYTGTDEPNDTLGTDDDLYFKL